MNYTARLNKIIFLPPLLFLICIGAVYYYLPQSFYLVLLFLVFDFCWFFLQWITYHYSTLTITNTNVTLRKGFIVRQTMDIAINKIESVDITQSIIGALFNFGEIIIRGTGGTVYGMQYLASPLTCRRKKEELRNPV